MKRRIRPILYIKCGGSVQKTKKPWLERVNLVAGIVSSLSIFVGMLAFVSDVYPQFFPWNTDYVVKANAGDVKSQMFLAQHYYETGEYTDAIYWYKIASVIESDYQARACNNLGVIYANGYGLSDKDELHFEKAYRLFCLAEQLGLDEAKMNRVVVLVKGEDEDFPNLDSNERQEYLKENWYTKRRNTHYKSVTTYKGPTFWEGNSAYVYSGAYVDVFSNSPVSRVAYKYYGVEFESDKTLPDYTFIEPEL